VEKRIILLHGWGATAGKLELLELELKKQGWETMNLNLPGFGLAPPDRAWNVGDYVSYVSQQAGLKWGNKTWMVFGHSFGGRVAIKLAVGGKVTAVVLCAPGGLSRSIGARRIVFWILAKLGKLLGLQKYKWLLYKLAREHDYEQTTGVMRETFKLVLEENLRSELDKITVPTLILWGEQDRVVPKADGIMAKEKITTSKLVLIANQGHRLPYEQPEKVALEINTWYQSL